MNRSGECIRKLVEFYKLNPREQVLVISDDIDLPLGEIRVRMKGGPGTHNGLRSIVVTLGEEFPRIRVGIGTQPTGEDLATWVVSAFSNEEQKTIGSTLKTLPEKVKEFVMESTAE
jgi:PTH1 family peptidyl-tRNA hydrolase